MDYRVLVLDLDGTTLNEHGELEDRDVEAARALIEAGVSVTIATGRLFLGTQWVAKALGVQGEVAVMNGAEHLHAHTGQVSFGRYLDPEHRGVMRRALAEHDLDSALLFGSRSIDLDRRDEGLLPYLRTWTPNTVMHDELLDSDRWEGAEDVLAMGAIGDEHAIASVREHIHTHIPHDLFSVTFRTRDGRTVLSVRTSGEDKGTALDRLAAERGCTAEACVAVGDWFNDVPMLQRAGLSWAMAHSVPEVRESADEVLDAPRHGGGAIVEVARRVWGISA